MQCAVKALPKDASKKLTVFNNTQFRDEIFVRRTYYGVGFLFCVFQRVRFIDCRFEKCLFTHGTFENCKFEDVHFSRCIFSKSSTKNCLWGDVKITDCIYLESPTMSPVTRSATMNGAFEIEMLR